MKAKQPIFRKKVPFWTLWVLPQLLFFFYFKPKSYDEINTRAMVATMLHAFISTVLLLITPESQKELVGSIWLIWILVGIMTNIAMMAVRYDS